jgi:uncharacterized protein YigA (DUF484 family)
MSIVETRRTDAETVEQYLRTHPEFFASRSDLLMALEVPHSTGGAVSLVERQVALLRDQNRRYRKQLQNLVQIARTNDDLIGRLQRLTLRLLCLSGIDAVLAVLEQSLKEDFQADHAALHLFSGRAAPASPYAGAGLLSVTTAGDGAGDELARLLASGKPVCGRLGKDQLFALFGPASEAIASTAVLPLQAPEQNDGQRPLMGTLAIGSRDDERFNAEMDTHYLVHMSELIARKIDACPRAGTGA